MTCLNATLLWQYMVGVQSRKLGWRCLPNRCIGYVFTDPKIVTGFYNMVTYREHYLVARLEFEYDEIWS